MEEFRYKIWGTRTHEHALKHARTYVISVVSLPVSEMRLHNSINLQTLTFLITDAL